MASKTITMGSRHFASFPHHLGSFPHQICFISPQKLLHLPNNMLHKIISYHIISPTDCFNFYKKNLTSPTLFCVTIGKVSQKKMRKSLVIHQTGWGGHPEPNFIFEEKKFLQGPHRTILGHHKHVLHLVPSPNAIAKAFYVM